MVLRIQPEGSCPVCIQPRVRRFGKQLPTCGGAECAIELRARQVRGNEYGNRGGGPPATEAARYSAVHARARRALKGMPCALKDGSCAGRLEVALRPDVRADQLRADPGDDRFYFFGLNVADGYRNLCRSHHAREGGLQAAVRRDKAVASAVAIERLREAHAAQSCDPDCLVCDTFSRYDEISEALLHIHLVPRRSRRWPGAPVDRAGQDARACRHGLPLVAR
jgi:hypothetical protein